MVDTQFSKESAVREWLLRVCVRRESISTGRSSDRFVVKRANTTISLISFVLIIPSSITRQCVVYRPGVIRQNFDLPKPPIDRRCTTHACASALTERGYGMYAQWYNVASVCFAFLDAFCLSSEADARVAARGWRSEASRGRKVRLKQTCLLWSRESRDPASVVEFGTFCAVVVALVLALTFLSLSLSLRSFAPSLCFPPPPLSPLPFLSFSLRGFSRSTGRPTVTGFSRGRACSHTTMSERETI